MSRFILRRVLYSLVTLFILSATIFVIVRLTGDPLALMAEASARPEDLDRIRHQWGLDRSWPVQYATFMQNAFKGELGKSFKPSRVVFVDELPRTRSAKIVRRALRAMVMGKDAGDLSSLENPGALDSIRGRI